jgi:bla regulator protein blaR1
MKQYVKNAHTFAAVLALGAWGALGQTPVPMDKTPVDGTAGPKFEVASIKPADPNLPGFGIRTAPGGRYIATGVTVKFLIAQAYGVMEFQVSGGPGWIANERYEINAKQESGLENKPGQMALLLQGLLADRFQLKLTHETKELPIYALVVAKGGSKLKENTVEGGMSMGPRMITVKGMGIGSFTKQLSQQLGRPVLDRTGLTSRYDFKLEWTPDSAPTFEAKEGAPAVDSTAPSLFTALQEQLGLKLESTRGPVEILVIDHAEKPSEN